jgi:hypothetical protein
MANITTAPATKLVAPVTATKNVAPATVTVANPFSTALANIAKKGNATAKQAAAGVQAATSKPAVATIAPVGVATRNAGQAATMPGFALVGVNGRKQPLASSVTAAIWQAALAHQIGANGAMPTQAHIKLACPTVNPTSCGLGLTQYKAYTGQLKGKPLLTIAQLRSMATPAK